MGRDMGRDMGRGTAEPIFVVQLHDATTLHFDVRLQVGDVLASWAVPKGPSLDPSVKRLAKQVGDHELGHADFEGRTPGTGGTGTVIVWDRGTLENLTSKDGHDVPLRDAIERGHLKVRLTGERLTGAFALTRTSMNGDPSTWILVKVDDEGTDRRRDPAATERTSVLTGRTNRDLEG
jgi:DNA ligase D-like protein (predicted 3'-phosphoesterase)